MGERDREKESTALDKREYLMIFFSLFLIETICYDPSSEPSRWGVFDDHFFFISHRNHML